jgi:hypothetical protein
MIAGMFITFVCFATLVGFILVTWAYDRGRQDGYDAGHDDGFAHGQGQQLPPIDPEDRWSAVEDR